jgi:hypothetical protein
MDYFYKSLQWPGITLMFDSFQNYEADFGNGKSQPDNELRQDLEALSQSVQQLALSLSEMKPPNNTVLLGKVEDLQTEIVQALETINQNITGYDSASQRLTEVEGQVEVLNSKVDRLEGIIVRLDRMVVAHLDWKVLAMGLGLVIVGVALGTTMSLQIFPPAPDAFVRDSMQLIFERIEAVRKQTKR